MGEEISGGFSARRACYDTNFMRDILDQRFSGIVSYLNRCSKHTLKEKKLAVP